MLSDKLNCAIKALDFTDRVGLTNRHILLSCHSGLDPASSMLVSAYWMPVEDPVFSGDQVRHDGQK